MDLHQPDRKRVEILAICGNTRPNSINEQVLNWIANRYSEQLNFKLYNQIAELPHFRPDLTGDNAPEIVKEFYELINQSDAVIICSPEYVFSLPGTIKNALDWTVSTTVFSEKPTAIIVASSLGEKALEALNLIMTTLGANVNPDCSLLISSIKTNIDSEGNMRNERVIEQIDLLIETLVQKFKIRKNC
jgi:NAD(P)H-dependent FMN reductase